MPTVWDGFNYAKKAADEKARDKALKERAVELYLNEIFSSLKSDEKKLNELALTVKRIPNAISITRGSVDILSVVGASTSGNAVMVSQTIYGALRRHVPDPILIDRSDNSLAQIGMELSEAIEVFERNRSMFTNLGQI